MVLLIPRRIEHLKDLGRREGQKEGRREERRKWMAWNERRMSAEREGRLFNEPPPGDVREDNDE